MVAIDRYYDIGNYDDIFYTSGISSATTNYLSMKDLIDYILHSRNKFVRIFLIVVIFLIASAIGALALWLLGIVPNK